MKYVVGVVPASSLEPLRAALGRAGVYRLTVGEVEVVATAGSEPRGIPPQGGVPELGARVRLEVAVNDDFLEPTLEAFRAAASRRSDSAQVGDGQSPHSVKMTPSFVDDEASVDNDAASLTANDDGWVCVFPLEDALRIRTGEKGPDAI